MPGLIESEGYSKLRVFGEGILGLTKNEAVVL